MSERSVRTKPWVVVAPDKLKGSCSAAQAAQAIVDGLREVWGDRVAYRQFAMADGGEGTVEAFLDAGARAITVAVRGPLGDAIEARYARDGEVAVIEMAAASGIGLLGTHRDPMHATTYGTGQLIRHALKSGARRIILGIGGSATTDGGAGALAALGVRFFDAVGGELAPVPAELVRVARIDARDLEPDLARITLEVACDVANPLLGARGAATVYGPQKGATRAQVAHLDETLARIAACAQETTGLDLREVPGAGAAGGLGWGLATFCGAKIRAGFSLVAEVRGLPSALAGALMCITAEGSIDAQTLQGKVVAGVAALGRAADVPVIALCGRLDPSVEPALWSAGAACLPIVPGPLDRARAMRQAPELIRAAAARLARLRSAAPLDEHTMPAARPAHR